VETVVKASQALSSEIVLPKLIEKLMRIAVEHAGAERGLLILLRGPEPQIEAEAATGHGTVEVTVRQAPVTPDDLPQSALQYVIRARERVVLDDASLSDLHSGDEHVQQSKRSKVPSGGSASPEKSIAAWMQELSELDVGGGGRLRRSFRLCS
jgi:GAF domain-containing protein